MTSAKVNARANSTVVRSPDGNTSDGSATARCDATPDEKSAGLTRQIHGLEWSAMTTRLHYFKRYRMVIDLAMTPVADALLPDEYVWGEWDESDVERHALVKHRSFRDEMDSDVFPNLGDYFGCVRLMNEISQQDGFLAPATWLIVHRGGAGIPEDCGTIQGLGASDLIGSIQNVGVVPEHRGLGLGRALVLKSLAGFAMAGRRRIVLEVTAGNRPAVDLYLSIGFRTVRTMYRTAIFEERLCT